jgi:ligand-binding sensor domain-containing protein/signal transduction histidine kinase
VNAQEGHEQQRTVSSEPAARSSARTEQRVELNPFTPAFILRAACCLLAAACLLCAQTATDTSTLPASNLHQWGAVTLFHGLPSDRVRALVQDGEGAMWFGTDNGLARYDGRRTQSVQVAELGNARVLALKFDDDGGLWVGTDAGAARMLGSAWQLVTETRGKAVTAIALVPGERGRAWLATQQGQLFDCRAHADGTLDVRALPGAPLVSADADKPGALALTSLAFDESGTLYVGSRSRGLLRVERDQIKEVNSRPRAFFVEALSTDAAGKLWLGARARATDSGLYQASEPLRPAKVGAGLGTITALVRDAGAGVWVATDGQGVWRYEAGRARTRFTFEGTGGGLRSDHVYSVFVDREGVVWFGTDRGVCRFDASAPHNETVSAEAENNFVRVLHERRNGELLCGTNRGLFIYDPQLGAWRGLEQLARKTVYALAEDAQGRLLVGTSSGLYVGVSTKRGPLNVRESVAPEAPETEETGAAGTQPTKETPPAPRADTPRPAAGVAAQNDNTQVQGPGVPPPAAPAANAKEQRRGAKSEEKGPQPHDRNEPARVESVRALRNFQGAVYVASYGVGVDRLDGARRTHVWPAANTDARLREVTALYAEGDARLWIGTAHAGLFVYENGQTSAGGAALAQLAGAAIWAVDGRSDGALWFATERGLYLYRGGQLTTVLANADVRGVVADEGDEGVRAAWCATAGSGLLRVKLDEQFGPLSSRLDVEQGLASAQTFALIRAHGQADADRGADANASGPRGADGAAAGGADENSHAESLLIGTSRGVVRYSPGQTAPALVPVRVLSRRLHQPDELRAGIELPYPQNSLALDVAALSSRTYPEQFQYAFVLRDGAGRELRRKLAHDAQFVMENLAPGRYRVEARTYTKDLTASAPLAFAFSVGRAPFPWTTTMLAVLLVLALVALTWGAVQNRRIARTSAALRNAHHELAGARLELANEAERERRRIARDLHDQTLADLRSLMLLADELPTDLSANGESLHVEPARFRAEIESVSQEIRRICEDLSPSVLENVGLAAALEFALANAVAHAPPAHRFAYEFACAEDFDERLALAPGERMQLYRITQEAINNICRHAQAGHVRLTVALAADGELTLLLEDDGRSFDLKEAKKGRGLANIRARASLIEAAVTWTRRPTGGTLFTLRKASAAQAVPSASNEHLMS